MKNSLSAMLAGIVDYAGHFAPAKLPLDEAARRFGALRGGPAGWLVGRFVAPAARLDDLAPLLPALGSPLPPIAAIGRGGADAAAALAGLDRDLGDVDVFLGHHPEARVELCETRLPAPLCEPARRAELEQYVERALDLVERSAPAAITLFFEGSYGPDWRRSLVSIAEAIAEAWRRRGAGAKALGAGFKLRCGGAAAQDVPPAEQVALALAVCRDHGVPFKATEGLNLPVRRLDHQLFVKQHGFLNIFGAAALAAAQGLDEAQLAEIVADEDPAAFVFAPDEFRWREFAVASDEIAASRAQFAGSFGGCRVEEAHAALGALGLVD